MIVIDASVVIEVLLQTPDGVAITDMLLGSGRTWHAPYLLDVEVAQVLRRYVAREELAEERARQALELLTVLPVSRYGHEPLLERIWWHRENLTAYDAAYVAIAEGLRVPFVTRDRRLATAPALSGLIELV